MGSLTEWFYGYHEHTLVQVPQRDPETDSEPRLIRRFTITPANADVVEPSFAVIETLPTPATDPFIDRHYPLASQRFRATRDLELDRCGGIGKQRILT